MLPVKKLYIDSKARTADSRSTSNFSLDLTESLTMPEGAVFQVCDVLIPHSWYLIDDSNRNLYFFELNGLVGSGFFTIALNIGNYLGPDLAGEIGRALHAQATKFFSYNVSYDDSTRKIHISASTQSTFGIHSWKILTDKEALEVPDFGISKANSLNKFLGITTTMNTFVPGSDEGFFSNHLQFDSIKYLFIKSANLGTFNTMGSFGERTIIKKVPVTAGKGEMILDDTRSGNDMLSCEKQTLKRLEFQITDELGNTMDLQGHDVSWSLIFSIMP
jgi:hypothetical protein